MRKKWQKRVAAAACLLTLAAPVTPALAQSLWGDADHGQNVLWAIS